MLKTLALYNYFFKEKTPKISSVSPDENITQFAKEFISVFNKSPKKLTDQTDAEFLIFLNGNKIPADLLIDNSEFREKLQQVISPKLYLTIDRYIDFESISDHQTFISSFILSSMHDNLKDIWPSDLLFTRAEGLANAINYYLFYKSDFISVNVRSYYENESRYSKVLGYAENFGTSLETTFSESQLESAYNISQAFLDELSAKIASGEEDVSRFLPDIEYDSAVDVTPDSLSSAYPDERTQAIDVRPDSLSSAYPDERIQSIDVTPDSLSSAYPDERIQAVDFEPERIQAVDFEPERIQAVDFEPEPGFIDVQSIIDKIKQAVPEWVNFDWINSENKNAIIAGGLAGLTGLVATGYAISRIYKTLYERSRRFNEREFRKKYNIDTLIAFSIYDILRNTNEQAIRKEFPNRTDYLDNLYKKYLGIFYIISNLEPMYRMRLITDIKNGSFEDVYFSELNEFFDKRNNNINENIVLLFRREVSKPQFLKLVF